MELSKAEVLRLIDEFEQACLFPADKTTTSCEHPDSSANEQMKFLRHLNELVNVVKEGRAINPFRETGPELVTLDTGEVMDPEIANSFAKAEHTGRAMYSEFVRDRIENATKAISDVIPRAKLYTFSNQPPANLKADSRGSSSKANLSLVTKLFLALQACPESDLDYFFKHENQREPPSLSDDGRLNAGTKSALLSCLPKMPLAGRSPAVRAASVIVMDMAAVIHMIKPQRARFFGDYVQMHLLPFLQKQVTADTTRIDAVWDTYQEASLKLQTRARRGDSERRRTTRVSAQIPLPKGAEWQKFLKESQNKDQLFQFLSSELEQHARDEKYHLLTTKADLVLSNRPMDVSALSPCKQEEADTRMILHLKHAANQGHSKVYIRTVDTDVVVLAVHFFSQLNLTELWIGFGSGRTFKEIPIHDIVQELGPQQCHALPFATHLLGAMSHPPCMVLTRKQCGTSGSPFLILQTLSMP